MPGIGDVFMRFVGQFDEAQVTKASEAAGDKASATFGSKLKKGLSVGISAGLAASVAALTGVGIKGLVELDQAMANFRADTGATEEDVQKATAATNKLFRNNLAGYKEIGQTLGKLRTDIGLSQDAADEAAQSYLDFAKVAGEDGPEAVSQFDDILDAFNLDASKAPGIMDQLIASHQKYGGSIADNAKSLALLAPQLQGLNLGIDDGIGLLNLFAASGIDASKATFALNTAVQKLKPGQSINDVIAQIAAIEDPAKRARKAVEFFGARGGVALAQALRPGVTSLKDFGISADDAAGATKKASDQIDSSFGNRVQLWLKNIAGLSTEILQKFGPAIAGIGPIAALVLPGLSKHFKDLFDFARKQGPAAFAALSKAMLTAEGRAKALSLASNGLKVALAIAVAAAAVTATKAVSDWTQELIYGKKKADLMKAAAEAMGEGLFGEGKVKAYAKIAKAAESLGISWEEAAERALKAQEAGGKSFDEILDDMIAHTGTVVQQEAGILSHAAQERIDILKDAKPATQRAAEELAATIPDALKAAADQAGATISGGPGHWAATLSDGTRIVSSSAEQLAASIPAAVAAAKNAAGTEAAKIPQAIVDALHFSPDQKEEWKTELTDLLETTLSDAEIQAAAVQVLTGKQVTTNLKEGVKKGKSALITETADVVEDTITTIEAFNPGFIETGKGIPKNAAKGLEQNANLLIQGAREVINSTGLEMTVPEYFDSIGDHNTAAFIRGFMKRKGQAQTEAGQLAVGAAKMMNLDLFQPGWNVGQSWVDGLIAAMRANRWAIAQEAGRATSGLRGKSPPKEGPLKEIDTWGRNVGLAWVEPFLAVLRGMDVRGALSGLQSSLAAPAPALAGISAPAIGAQRVSGLAASQTAGNTYQWILNANGVPKVFNSRDDFMRALDDLGAFGDGRQ